jgi:hypothetical protein
MNTKCAFSKKKFLILIILFFAFFLLTIPFFFASLFAFFDANWLGVDLFDIKILKGLCIIMPGLMSPFLGGILFIFSMRAEGKFSYLFLLFYFIYDVLIYLMFLNF